MTLVEEKDCVACRAQSGEIEADKVTQEERLIMGEIIPLEVSTINVYYVDEDGITKQRPLCKEHQRMLDAARFIY